MSQNIPDQKVAALKDINLQIEKGVGFLTARAVPERRRF
jgi:hypothetical protein